MLNLRRIERHDSDFDRFDCDVGHPLEYGRPSLRPAHDIAELGGELAGDPRGDHRPRHAWIDRGQFNVAAAAMEPGEPQCTVGNLESAARTTYGGAAFGPGHLAKLLAFGQIQPAPRVVTQTTGLPFDVDTIKQGFGRQGGT